MVAHHRPDPDSDPFHPPAISIHVHCLHCDREYDSYLIEWREEQSGDELLGFWCCPTPGCDGKGFGFDIFPTDPEYRDESGELMWVEDEDEEEDFEPSEEFQLGEEHFAPPATDEGDTLLPPAGDDDDPLDERQIPF